jgi:hypothetical protein
VEADVSGHKALGWKAIVPNVAFVFSIAEIWAHRGGCRVLQRPCKAHVVEFETATGTDVFDMHLNYSTPESHPSWKPRLRGPISVDDFTKFLREGSVKDVQDIIPPCGDTFHYNNSLLGAEYVFVSYDAKITRIVDWKCAASTPILLRIEATGVFYLPHP